MMQQTYTTRDKWKLFGKICLPILFTQLSLFAMSFFDTIMSGRASSNDLAGVAIGSSLWSPLFVGLNGILITLTPIISQLIGARREEEIPAKVQQGLYLAFLLSLLVILLGVFCLEPLLLVMNITPEVKYIAFHYLIALAWGMIPLFFYSVLNSFINALGYTRVSMVITLISLPLNIVLNYLLIFGVWGFPRLGGIGAGYSTAITYWFMCLVSLWIVHRMSPFASYKVLSRWFPPSMKAWKEQLSIGVPVGFMGFFEISIFAAVTILVSSFGTVTVAAHQAALNFASFVYNVPVSIGMALTIVVGFEAGAKRYQDARTYSWIGIGTSIMLTVTCGILLLLFIEPIAALYTNEADVLEMTKHFLLYAVFFQLSDGIAAPIQGVLRGYKDVNVAFGIAFLSYWILGLPLGYVFAKYTALGAGGYWMGLISGLAFGAIFLSLRLMRLHQLNRVELQASHS